MRKVLFVALAAICAVSCGPDENKLASRYLDAAMVSLDNGDIASAKLLIDSVKILYPKALDARREGLALMRKAELAEASRTIAYQDSVLAILNARLDDVKNKYAFEKDDEYQDVGLYSMSSQASDKNVGRNYIKAQVDENGSMTLVSSYKGNSYIHHRSVRLSVGDNYVESPKSDNFHEFQDLDVCYEKCNLTDGTGGGLASFVALNCDAVVKVTLIGERTISYNMSKTDKYAIKDVYSLALLLKEIAEARSIRDESLRKQAFINANMAKADSQEPYAIPE